MYLTRVEIQNIRAIRNLVWEIKPENAAGWHVILGDNGAGKSTFVRCTVLLSLGFNDTSQLYQYWAKWLPINDTQGHMKCNRVLDKFYDKHTWPIQTTYTLRSRAKADRPVIEQWGGPPPYSVNPDGTVAAAEVFDYFVASFGPFRRFNGGDAEEENLFASSPILSRHRTTFSESLALPDALRWLKDTHHRSVDVDDENNGIAKKLIENIKAFINQPDFLPHNTRLDKVNSSGVHFVDGNGASVAAEELSDGYRSVLSLTFELLRLLSLTHGPDIFETDDETKAITVAPPGVVLIDEVDAHLHPTWQKRIGFWLRKHFPKMQWIVTTHSPLICQAAEKGTIYKLPTPGTDETGRMLTGTERDRLVYGDILDAYSTEAFGAGITRSEASQEKLDRLGELNVKEIINGLTPEETKEQEELRAMLPTTAAALPDEGLPV